MKLKRLIKNSITESKLWVIISLFSLLGFFLYFSHLFFPQLNIYVTPDLYRSDIWHYHLPVKHLLHLALQNGQLPFWVTQIGTGFPLFSEGQVGALFLPNLFFFGLFETVLGWNLQLVFLFWINFIGMVWVLRLHKINLMICVASGLVYSLSGFFVMRILHYSMLQAAVLLPWIFGASLKIYKTLYPSYVLFMALLIGQQVFTGYFQICFMTAVLVFSYHGLNQILNKSINKTFLYQLIFSFILGIMFAAPQLLPSFEMLTNSQHYQGNKEVFEYPYPISSLITWIWPNYFGTPKDASYSTDFSKWGLYWENTFYLGIIPILMTGYFVFFRPIKKKEKIWIWILLSCVLIVFGRLWPIDWLFKLPGFGTFRVLSRYFLVFVFGLSIFWAIKMNQIWQQSKQFPKIILTLIILLAIFDVWNFGHNYHPYTSAKNLLSKPEIIAPINSDERVFTYPTNKNIWLNQFSNSGWLELEPYIFMKQALAPNSHLFWDLIHVDSYTGLYTNRQAIFYSQFSRSLLNLTATQWVISPQPLGNTFNLVKTVNSNLDDMHDYYLYQNPSSYERFRLVGQTKFVPDLKNQVQIITSGELDFNQIALVETDIKLDSPNLKTQIELILETPTRKTLSVTADKPSLLVIADSFDLNWQVKVNDKQSKLHPININQQGILLSSKENLIELIYFPKYFYYGWGISFLGFILWFGYYLYEKNYFNFRLSFNRL